MMGSFTALDVIVLVLVGLGLVRGFMRGFVTEVISLVSWIAAIAALNAFHGPLTARLGGLVGTPSGAAVLAFVLIFLIVFALGKYIAHRIGGATRNSIVGPVDRVLGAGFGMLKGLIGATLLYLAASLVYDTVFGRDSARPDWMAQSRTYPLLDASGRAIVGFIEARREHKPAGTTPASA
jgi:membrane protein required for colicin V production